MVSRSGHYYGAPFTGSRGVTHGDPLSPNIFNMVVNVVIFHWETRVSGEDADPKWFRRTVQKIAALLYAEDSLLALPRPAMSQEVLDILTGLFYRFILRNNVSKTMGIVCQLCWSAGRKSTDVYIRRITGEGRT